MLSGIFSPFYVYSCENSTKRPVLMFIISILRLNNTSPFVSIFALLSQFLEKFQMLQGVEFYS